MPLPEVLESVRGWRQHLNNFNQQAWQTQARAWVQLERDITAEAMNFRRAHSEPMTPGELYRLDRYNHLIDDVRGHLQQYAYSTNVLTQSHLQAVMDQSVFHARELMANAPNAVGFSRVNRDNIESAVGLTREGSVLYNHLQRTSNIALMDFQRNLVRGIGLGYNPRKMARLAVQEGLGASYSRFSTIFRTEALRVARNTILESFRGNPHITGYRRLSALDRRSCIGCIVAHGRVYNIDVQFEEHPNGRCTLVPIFDYDDEWEPRYDGENWFRSQTPEIQKEILGPGRHDLFKAGTVAFNQLATLKEDAVWGNSIVRTPLKVLQAGEGGIPFIPPFTRPSPAAMNALPAATPAATQTLAPLEEKIRNIHSHEQAYIVGTDGRLVAHVLGRGNSVDPGPALQGHTADQKRNYVMTHNHPSGYAAFSEVDLASFFKMGLKEIRTVAVDGTWSFRHTDVKGPRKTYTWFERTFKKLLPSVRQSVVNDLRARILNPNVPPAAYAMERMSKALAEESKGKLVYERVSTSHE